MHNPAKLIIFLLLLQFCSGKRWKYQKILENERLEEKLRLLGPEVILHGERNFGEIVGMQCAKELTRLRQAHLLRESWALRMVDSSTRLPSGILEGNIVDYGSFDECMAVVENKYEKTPIRGHHCMYSIEFNEYTEKFLPISPTFSICLPSNCTSQDLSNLIRSRISGIANSTDQEMEIHSTRCTDISEVPKNNELVIFLSIMLGWIGFLIICTLIDIWNVFFNENKHEQLKSLNQFSYLSNAKLILSMETHGGDLLVINGLRFINTMWLVLEHEYIILLFCATTNILDLLDWFTKSWSVLLPLAGNLVNDTFLALSGFLIAYTCLKKMQKRQFNVLHFYIHRFFRITPLVAVTVYCFIVVGDTLGTGPRLEWLREQLTYGCRSKWWSYFLYISNFVDQENYCAPHLWSVTVDMQLSVIAPVILYFLYRTKRIGWIILFLSTLSSLLSYAYILGMNEYSALYISLKPSMPAFLASFNKSYIKPYTRAAPWLIGILFGYVVTTGTKKLTMRTSIVGWILTTASFIFCLVGMKSFTNENYEYNIIWEIAYGALSKLFWGFGVCWIIYSSIHNFGGPVSKLLSLRIFIPLSRLSYSISIIHVFFPFLFVATLRTPRYFHDYIVWHSYIGNMVLNIIAAFLFSLTFELPLRNLEQIFFSRKSAEKSTRIKHQKQK